MISIDKVGPEAIPQVQELAQLTWPVTYGPILPQEQLTYMLGLIYSTEALKAQMEKGHRFIIAKENNIPVGFAAYSVKDPSVSPSLFRLHKLYVDPGQQGKGIGRLLLQYIKDDIINSGATELELNVNRYNNARIFYERMGFTVMGEEDIDIGNGYFMNDYVMRVPLRDANF